MTDGEFLGWIADRFVNQYGESESVDFVTRLRKMADHAQYIAQGVLVVPDDMFAEVFNAIEKSHRLPVVVKKSDWEAKG